MLAAFVILVGSIVGIAVLFYAKYRELSTGRDPVPHVHTMLDVRATQIKELAFAAKMDLRRLPPALVRMLRVLVHALALRFASVARSAERQAHRLADMVSYKHHFERRAPRSEFLQKVIEHKNGGKITPDADDPDALLE